MEVLAYPSELVPGEALILGALDKSLIDKVVGRHTAQIRYCYQRELSGSPTLSGEIVVKFVISSDGSVSVSVSEAKTKSSTMSGGEAVQSCINSRFMRFQFPEPKGGGIVIVSYPFSFATLPPE